MRISDRHHRAAKRALRRIPDRAQPAIRQLNAAQRDQVIENLRDEFDLLSRGAPSAHDIETALQIAEACA